MTRVVLLVLVLTFVPRVAYSDSINNSGLQFGFLGWSWSTAGKEQPQDNLEKRRRSKDKSLVDSEVFLSNPSGVHELGYGVNRFQPPSGHDLDEFFVSHKGPREGRSVNKGFKDDDHGAVSFNDLTDEKQFSVSAPLQLPDFKDSEMNPLRAAAISTLGALTPDPYSQTGSQALSQMLTTAGSHPIGYGMFNSLDGGVAPSMHVDSVYATPAPVPEPSTIVMIISGLGIVWLSGRRRRTT